MGTPKDGIKILGTDYSRYVKLEADIRRYIFTGGKRAIALRAYPRTWNTLLQYTRLQRMTLH